MKRSLGFTLLLVCGAALTGCSDAVGPNIPGLHPSSPNGYAAESDPEEELPSEFEKPPTIIRWWTEVGFIPEENVAYAMGFMHYWANRARQTTTVHLRYGNHHVASRTNESAHDTWLPWYGELVTRSLVGLSGDCGHIVEGQSQHRAWHEAFTRNGWFSWGHVTQSSTAVDVQPTCPPSGGGGEPSEPKCITVYEDHWLYDPNTGEFEYQYTYTKEYCNDM